MRQMSLAEADFEKYLKPTRREQFLNDMDQIIPTHSQGRRNTARDNMAYRPPPVGQTEPVTHSQGRHNSQASLQRFQPI